MATFSFVMAFLLIKIILFLFFFYLCGFSSYFPPLLSFLFRVLSSLVTLSFPIQQIIFLSQMILLLLLRLSPPSSPPWYSSSQNHFAFVPKSSFMHKLPRTFFSSSSFHSIFALLACILTIPCSGFFSFLFSSIFFLHSSFYLHLFLIFLPPVYLCMSSYTAITTARLFPSVSLFLCCSFFCLNLLSFPVFAFLPLTLLSWFPFILPFLPSFPSPSPLLYFSFTC